MENLVVLINLVFIFLVDLYILNQLLLLLHLISPIVIFASFLKNLLKNIQKVFILIYFLIILNLYLLFFYSLFQTRILPYLLDLIIMLFFRLILVLATLIFLINLLILKLIFINLNLLFFLTILLQKVIKLQVLVFLIVIHRFQSMFNVIYKLQIKIIPFMLYFSKLIFLLLHMIILHKIVLQFFLLIIFLQHFLDFMILLLLIKNMQLLSNMKCKEL